MEGKPVKRQGGNKNSNTTPDNGYHIQSLHIKGRNIPWEVIFTFSIEELQL